MTNPIDENPLWPNELTPELRDILGMMCFEFIKLSQIFRAAGIDVPKHAEDEQAFFLHRLLGHWFRHGTNWRDAANADMREVAERAKQLAEPQP